MVTSSVFRRPGKIIRFENTTGEFGPVTTEIVRVFSSSGELLREYRGFCDMNFPERDRILINGGVLTCSHPLDTSFSRRDLVFASDFQLAEIRAFGKSRLYSMKPCGAAWPEPGQVERKYDEIRSTREFVSSITGLKKSPEFLAKSRDPEMDLFRIRQDLICERLAKDLGLLYRKATYSGMLAAFANPFGPTGSNNSVTWVK